MSRLDTLPSLEDLVDGGLDMFDGDDGLLSTAGAMEVDLEMAMLLGDAPSIDATPGSDARPAPGAKAGGGSQSKA